MKPLNLPFYQKKIKEEKGLKYIFDEIRKKYVRLTPEEWVRQNFVQYLISEKEFPQSLIVIEKGLTLNELKKRADILIYKNTQPILIVECKAPSVKISQETFNQIARYNMVFKVPYLIVTNGIDHYCSKINFESNGFEFLKDIPSYQVL